ncbi:MAG: CHASE domain-containing protein [Chloroflexi bacterium]|nr:CHASE domain-containing protein [Chloroflexota bacterium]
MGTILLLGAGASVITFLVAMQLARTRAEEVFIQQAEGTATPIRQLLERGLEVVRSVRNFYDASVEVERHEFTEFTKRITAEHREIQSLGWAPRVPYAKRGTFEDLARDEGFRGFQVTELSDDGRIAPAREQEDYYPVLFVEPRQGNEIVLGYDLGSDAALLGALEQARDTGEAFATGPVQLLQGPAQQLGFLVAVPVYEKGRSLSTVEERREGLQGFALGVFGAHALTVASFPGQTPSVAYDIYDTTDPEVALLVHRFHPNAPATPLEAGQLNDALRSGFQWTGTVSLPGRQWSLVAYPADGAIGGSLVGPWWLLGMGLVLTLAGSAFAYNLISQTERVGRLVTQRTHDLRETESRARTIVAYMDEGLVVAGPEDQIIQWNQVMEDLTGITSLEAMGRQIDDVMRLMQPDLGNPDIIEDLSSALVEKRKPEQPFLLMMERPQRLDLRVRMFYIATDSSEQLCGLLFQDVTPERDLERRRDAFVSVASHELRTPLTSLVGFSQFLLQRPNQTEETRRQSLEIIHQESLRLTSIVDDMLNVSRIQSGKLTVNLEPLGLAEAVEEGLIRVRPTTDQHEFAVAIPDDVPLVWGDRDKLVQVLINLLSNAVKYSPKGGRVTVSAGHEPVRSRVVVSVEDQGIGIAPQDKEKLFTTFHRIHSPDTEGVRGTGLGLYIVKGLLELLKGEVWVESELGRGSTFFFTLPTSQISDSSQRVGGAVQPPRGL